MNALVRLRTPLCLIIILTLAGTAKLRAEPLLDKVISIEVKRIPLQKTLELISRKGEFYFSYNSSIIKSDSIVSISLNNLPVKHILNTLLNKNYEFTETGNYIIIKKSTVHAVIINTKTSTQSDVYIISGYVVDDRTGQKISNASVYEKERLVSTLTNENGYFTLKLHSKYPTAAITISKEYYDDTTITVQPKYNQELTVTIVPIDTLPEITTISPVPVNLPAIDSVTVPGVSLDTATLIYTTKKVDSSWLQRTGLGRFFLSSAQKIQSLNIGKFIASKPYQISVIPGVSTHGKLSGQVVNDVSLNVLGGYNAGVNGAELGILFNIDRYDVKHAQLAGVFNVVGGAVTGVQAAGISNLVQGNVTGVQASGISNIVRGRFTGVQASAIYNHIEQSNKGIQVTGVANYTHHATRGVQVAGVANISNESMDGIQVAGVFNYTKKLHGIQVGLINIAGTSDGYSFGLINFVARGYHKISVSTNEVMNVNLAIKTGNTHLYSMLLGGMNVLDNKKLYSFGYGLGTQLRLGYRLSLNPEISSQYIYRGSWNYTNLLNKLSPQLNYRIDNFFTIFAGPVFNVYYSNQTTDVVGYKPAVQPAGYHLYDLRNNKLKSWIGWSVGVSLF